jgi:hypothetical protein
MKDGKLINKKIKWYESLQARMIDECIIEEKSVQAKVCISTVLVTLNEIKNTLVEQRTKAVDIFNKKHDSGDLGNYLEYYAWPQTFSGTNPFGPGGCAITSFTIECYHNDLYKDCVLFLCGRPQYHDNFKPFMRYNT